MVRIARRDTFGVEDIGGVRVKRRIFAGRPIPDHYEVAKGDVEDTGTEPPQDTPAAAVVATSETSGAAESTPPGAADEPKPTGGARKPRRSR